MNTSEIFYFIKNILVKTFLLKLVWTLICLSILSSGIQKKPIKFSKIELVINMYTKRILTSAITRKKI